ncbi:MAG: glycosyltransferase family 2 protein [Candidatus Pacebacteria bacterium]|nr:glycosyltransferase family 2 protein [Candidatus Paceibacterota bacterium]
MKKTVPLSVVVIAYNEEAVLEAALKSVAWADEIIVVDSGSTDSTLDIAKKFGAKTISHPFENYGSQKQFAVDQASHTWVFVLDADERVSAPLAESMLSTLKNPFKSAYRIQRKNYFLGREVTAQYWDNDTSVRLFDKTKHSFSKQRIHEKVVAKKSEVEKIKGVLYHLSHRSIAELSKKAHTYALLDAQERFTQNPPTITGWNIVSSAIKYFFRVYVTGGGYKDGTEGLLNALILTYQQRILIRSMLWEMQQKPSLESKYKSIDTELSKDRYEL